jgi:hypothetical protein
VDLRENPPLFSDLQIQSEELEDGSAVMKNQENLTFADAGLTTSLKEHTISFKPDCDDSALLGNYLSRPVAISTYSWAEGDTFPVQTTFLPWQLFFNNVSVKKKLDNYARLRCKLHLKFVVNASPFYYGALRVCYCPIDGGLRDVVESTQGDQIKFSQMPGDFLYPQDMTSFEMELPFLLPHSWLDITDNSEFASMGRITYLLYSKLRSANGSTGSDVNITCYAWATEVELAGLTSGLSLQGDEYESSGVISGPATAVANVAAKLSDAPIIGSLARATEIGARAVGGIASLFGYSNPPVIDDVHAFVPKSFHSFASVETGVPMDKLTIDPKNEVTIDKTVTGAKPDDELVITHFAGRRSFITGALWSGSYTPGTQILRIPVTPRNYGSNSGIVQTFINHTPAAHVAAMFSNWRGSMVYTLRFVKSRYHTGRLQVSWDPTTVPITNAETTTITRIIDLQYETEVSFTIPYKAQDPWLLCTGYGNNWATTTAGTVTYDPVAHNGIIRITVLTELTGPAASQEIDVLLFASAGPDISFSIPNETPLFSFLAVQSDESDSQLADVANTQLSTDTNAVTVGETIASLRTLLHRTTFYHRAFMGNQYSASGQFQTTAFYTLVNYIPRFPAEYGFNTQGVNYAVGLVDPIKIQFQFSPNTTLNWITNCFAGYRGGIVHQYNVTINGKPIPDSIAVERDPRTHILDSPPRQAINRFSVAATSGASSNVARAPLSLQLNVRRGVWGHRGMALTNANTQSGVSVVSPQYSRWKFRPAYVKTRDIYDNVSERESLKVCALLRCGMSTASSDEGWPVLETYVAGAVDFDPIYFICVPTLYSFSVPTADDSF